MLAKLLSSALRKIQLCEFLGLPQKTQEAKEQLVARLQALIETDASALARLLDTFPQELAVGPVELQELLHCSQVERRRWIKEDKIPVLEYRSFKEGRRELLYPVHDRRVVQHITQEEVARWRAEHQDQVRAHRQTGARAASESRKVNQRIRQDFLSSWKETLGEWTEQTSAALAAVLQLCFWTTWTSRWAKENHLKSLRGTKHAAVYAAQRDAWYERKNQAMRVLARTPYAHLSYYRPPDADKRSLWLCEEHYALKKEDYYDDIWDFFSVHTALIKQCPQCMYKKEKDYYALYYLEISAEEFPTLHFSFHMPYPIGKAWFPSPGKLPMVAHIEQDGPFRFGRTLLNEEKIVHREQDVLSAIEQTMAEVEGLFGINIQQEKSRELDDQG